MACLLLASLLWYRALTGVEPAGTPKPIAAAPLPRASGFVPAGPPPPEAYKTVLERPLFHPGRRPFAGRNVIAAAAAAAKPPPPRATPMPPKPALAAPQGLTLRGTIVSGPFRSAIFERTARRDYIRVEEGGQLEGWTLVKVTRSGIVLRAGSQELAMKLEAGLR